MLTLFRPGEICPHGLSSFMHINIFFELALPSTTQILVVLLIGFAVKEFSFNQSEALPTSG